MPGIVRYYLQAVLVALDVRIDSYHARFQNNNILCLQRDTATVLALMKQVLVNQNDTDIPVMSAFRI